MTVTAIPRSMAMPTWAMAIVVVVGYALATLLGNALMGPMGVSAFWPAAGFAAVMLLWAGTPWRRATALVAILVGYVAAEAWAGWTGVNEIGFAAANLIEPIVMLPFLIAATRRDRRLTSPISLLWFVVGCVVAPAVSGLFAATWSLLVGFPPIWNEVWTDWWAGDALGLLVVAPLLIQWRPARVVWSQGAPWEQVILWILVAGSIVQLATGPGLLALPLAALVVLALRLDAAATSLAVFLVSTSVVYLALDDTSALFARTHTVFSDVGPIVVVIVVVAQFAALSTRNQERAYARLDSALTTVAASEDTLRQALESGLDPFAIFEPDGTGSWRLLFINSEGGSTPGKASTDLVGCAPEQVIPVEALEQILPLMARASATGRPQRVLADVHTRSKGWRGDFSITAAPTQGDRVVVTWRDVTEMHATARHLLSAHGAAMHTSTHDALTNLPNALLFADRLDTALGFLPRTGDCLAVVFVDIDGFRHVNDRLGHLIGDTVLVRVSERLAALVEPGDTVARLAEDDFAILVTGRDSLWDPRTLCARTAEVLGEELVAGSNTVTVTASIGATLVRGTAPAPKVPEPDEVLQQAETAMLHSHALGGDRFTIFEEGMLDLAPIERLTAERLAEALERREFFLEYQPVIDLVSGTAIGHEALIRWRHPVWGSVAPATFLDVAETSGLIVNIGDWVIEQATHDLAAIPSDQWISVNLAPAQLLRRDLASSISSALVDAAADPGRLVLEITEGQLLEGTPAVLRRIEDLRSMGIRIAIDDFGSGYSSLAYLETFPVDVTKLDQGLLIGELGERKQRILRWMAQLSTTVDALTIIEGVETRDQLQMVQQSGLRYAQGYALARPAQLQAIRQPHSTPVVI